MQVSVFSLLLVFFLVGCSLFSSRDKETAQLYLKIGTSQLENGQYPQALASLLSAEKADDSNPIIQNHLALAYQVRGKLGLAEKHLRKALSLDSNYADAKNNLGKILTEQGRPSEAIPILETVVADLTYVNPEKPLLNLGIAHFRLKSFETSKDFFRKALEIQRDNCPAQSYFGRALYELKDFTNAAEALDRAVGFCQATQFDEPQFFSGLSYLEIGQREKSAARFEELLKLYPNGKYRQRAQAMLVTIRRSLR